MTNFYKKTVMVFFTITLFLFYQKHALGSHTNGGEITYKFISQNEVILIAKIYRDCKGIDVSATSFKLTPSCGSTATVSASISSYTDVTPTCKTACNRCTNSSCSFGFGFQECVIEGYVDLSTYSCCSFNFSWEQCCRNASLTTGGANENFYLTGSFNKCVTNNYVSFSYKPPLIVCKNQCISSFQSADAGKFFNTSNKDSISYELTEALDGPSSAIIYASGFSYNEPLLYQDYPNENSSWSSGCGGFHFNKATGELNFKATQEDKVLMAVKAIIWQRDSTGKYQQIGTIMREIQMAILTCGINSSPVVKGFKGVGGNTLVVQAGDTTKFNIETSDPDNDTLKLSWSTLVDNLTVKKSTVKSLTPLDTFSFSPDKSQVRSKPYSLIFTVLDDECPVPAFNQKILYLKVVPAWPKISLIKADSGCGQIYLSSTKDTTLGLKYKWYINGKLESDNQNFTFKARENKKHHLKLVLTAKNGSSKTFTDTFTTTEAVIASAGKDTGICKGGSVQLQASGGVKYKWYPAYGLSKDTIANPVASPDSTITYVVTVTDSNNCTATDSVKVSVTDFAITMSRDTAICAGNTRFIKIEASAPGAVSYKWFPGKDILDSTKSSTFARPFKTTTYTVYVTNAFGCTKKDSVTIFYNKAKANAGLDKTICLGDSVQLNGSGGAVYSWTNAYGITKTDIAKPWVKPVADQMYILTVRDSATCLSEPDTVYIKVKKLTTSISKSTTICKGDTVKLSVSGGNKYSWYPVKGLSGSTIASPSFYPLATSKYYVLITDTSTGCKKLDSVTITVDTNCVWPGDANLDKTADYLDVLDIALGYSASGSARINASTDWKAQTSTNWSKSSSTGVNYKHLDTNGDGKIDTKDTLAVAKNYGKTHLKNEEPRLAGNPNDPPIYFKYNKAQYFAGDTVSAALYLGNTDKPVKDVYGLGMKYFFSNPYMEPNTLSFTWDCEMLCGSKDNFQLYRQFNDKATGEGSIIRTDKFATSKPHGKIANITFVLRDSTYNYPKDGSNIAMDILQYRLIDMNGNEIPLYVKADSVKVYRSPNDIVGIENENKRETANVNIYPNPAQNQIYVQSEDKIIKELEIINVLGESVIHIQTNTNNTNLNIARLPTGVYFVRLRIENSFIQRKLVISR